MTEVLNSLLGGQFPQLPLADKRSLLRVDVGPSIDTALSSTSVAEVTLNVPPGKWKVAQSKIVCGTGGHTANDTNYHTITLAKRVAGAYGTPVTILTYNTKITGGIGNLTAFTPLDNTASIDTTKYTFDAGAGDLLTFKAVVAAAGALPAGTKWIVELERAE